MTSPPGARGSYSTPGGSTPSALSGTTHPFRPRGVNASDREGEMKASSPKHDNLGLDRLGPEEQEALRDFWKVYDAHYQEISDEATEHLKSDPEVGPLIDSIPEDQREAQSRVSRELMQKAIE